MTTQEVQTVNNKLDLVLVVLAVAVLLAGVLGFSLLSERTLLIRIGILIGGLVIAVGIAWFSHAGKRFLAFSHEAYEETRRVTWPSRKEKIKTTGNVVAFVAIMAIFLFIVDKSPETGLYEQLLR